MEPASLSMAGSLDDIPPNVSSRRATVVGRRSPVDLKIESAAHAWTFRTNNGPYDDLMTADFRAVNRCDQGKWTYRPLTT